MHAKQGGIDQHGGHDSSWYLLRSEISAYSVAYPCSRQANRHYRSSPCMQPTTANMMKQHSCWYKLKCLAPIPFPAQWFHYNKIIVANFSHCYPYCIRERKNCEWVREETGEEEGWPRHEVVIPRKSWTATSWSQNSYTHYLLSGRAY